MSQEGQAPRADDKAGGGAGAGDDCTLTNADHRWVPRMDCSRVPCRGDRRRRSMRAAI